MGQKTKPLYLSIFKWMPNGKVPSKTLEEAKPVCKRREPGNPGKSMTHRGGVSGYAKCWSFESKLLLYNWNWQINHRIIQSNQLLKIYIFVGSDQKLLSNISSFVIYFITSIILFIFIKQENWINFSSLLSPPKSVVHSKLKGGLLLVSMYDPKLLKQLRYSDKCTNLEY